METSKTNVDQFIFSSEEYKLIASLKADLKEFYNQIELFDVRLRNRTNCSGYRPILMGGSVLVIKAMWKLLFN
eukprot:snap_masked-scaffold_36-processed-gene-1.48-mRNA-1 protein AED:1.00 eAED:1.00 QI:0/-1/0/0/-1/1/1/0/72